MTQTNRHPTNSIEPCVFAALETMASLRNPTADSSADTESGFVDRLIATIGMEALRIQAGDLRTVDAVFASQALALDAVFNQVLRDALDGDSIDCQPLALALKAQTQSRATLNSLVVLKHLRLAARLRRATDSTEQTDENGDSDGASSAYNDGSGVLLHPDEPNGTTAENSTEQTVENGNSSALSVTWRWTTGRLQRQRSCRRPEPREASGGGTRLPYLDVSP
jgi:hypothetical protein